MRNKKRTNKKKSSKNRKTSKKYGGINTNLESTNTNLESTNTNLESTNTKLESTNTNLESDNTIVTNNKLNNNTNTNNKKRVVTSKTFCCNQKQSDKYFFKDTNVGRDCYLSENGNCNIGYGTGQNYKFKCYNEGANKTIESMDKKNGKQYIPEIRAGVNNCKYESGVLSKITKGTITTAGVTAAAAGVVVTSPAWLTAVAIKSAQNQVAHGKGGGRRKTSKKSKKTSKKSN